MTEGSQRVVWDTFAKAIDVESREYRVIRGASGLEHPVQLLGMDEKNKRLVLVSSEPNSRTAALMQVDVQAALPDYRVVVVRPIIFDMGVLARKFIKSDSSAIIDVNEIKIVGRAFEIMPDEKKLEVIKSYLDPVFQQILAPLTRITLPAFGQIIELFQQAANFDWRGMEKTIDGQASVLDLTSLRNIDNLAADRQNGVCPIPMYEFDERTWELFSDAGHPDDVRGYLKESGVYQFFFPPPDQLALGIIDRGLKDRQQVVQVIEAAPSRGHPLGESELVKSHTSIPQVLGELDDLGYVAEGEHGIEITPAGTTTRSVIKYRPRESVFQRLLNRFSLNVSISPKDFMH